MIIPKFILQNRRLEMLLVPQFFRFFQRPYLAWRKIPIVAITGTNGKTTNAKLLYRIYLAAGYRVAMCCTEGAYRNDVLLEDGDQAGGLAIYLATRHQKIDIVVAETAGGGMFRNGLGFYTCRVGVVTNVYEDHLGLEGDPAVGLEGVNTLEQMAEVKSAIPRHTHPDGAVVLNGDHPLVQPMAAKTRASTIYFTVEDRQNEFDHCYYFKDRWIFRKYGSNSEPIIDVETIPITLQGELIYNIANSAAVLAAVEGMQTKVPVPLETAQSVLQEFGKDPEDNPARFTMLRLKDVFVLLCRCKNPESSRRDVEVIQKIQRKYQFDCLIGVMTAPGNRREDHIKKLSANCANICEYVFVRPPAEKYLRTRTGQEIVRLLSANIPKERILSTKNLPLAEVINITRKKVIGSCLYVYFNALWNADLDFPTLINQAKIVPIDIN
jgi:cyanophycin synthetase